MELHVHVEFIQLFGKTRYTNLYDSVIAHRLHSSRLIMTLDHIRVDERVDKINLISIVERACFPLDRGKTSSYRRQEVHRIGYRYEYILVHRPVTSIHINVKRN